MMRTKLFPGLLVVLLCCNSGPGTPPDDPDRSDAPPPEGQEGSAATAPAVRIERPPELSPFTPSLVANLRRISERRARRQDDVFMKVGDSSTVSRGFLECLSDPDQVTLGRHRELRPTLEHFREGNAGGRDPFRRQSLAAAEGWSARPVLTGHPPPLLREVRAIRPRFAFVMNGGNDVEGHDDYQYATRMLRIVELLSRAGVIPVLNSIPPRADDEQADRWVARYNQVSWAIARARRLPYLDYHQVMEELPRRGLAGDGVHPNIFIEDNRGQACRFHRRGLHYGHNQRNLLALRALDRLRRTVIEGQRAPDPPEPELSGAGTVSSPYRLEVLPFADYRDTRREGSRRLSTYSGCHATQDESGRELVYRMTVRRPLTIRAMAVGRRGADVDVHLLRGSATPGACVARDDREVVHRLSPGTWYVVVDTFVAEGDPQAGEVLVLIAPTDGPPPPR